MKKETAVEWLYEISKKRELDNFDLELALVMEKLQIVDAFNSGDFMHHYKIDIDKDGYEYYNEIYGK